MPRTVTADEILHVGDSVKLVLSEGESLSLCSAALESGLVPSDSERRVGLAATIVTMYEDLDVIALVIKPELAEGLEIRPGQTMLLEKPTEEGLWLGATSLRSLRGCRIELSWPTNSASIERREYCRVPLMLQTRYALADAQASFETGMLRDISGGGARLAVQQAVSAGQRLILEIPLDDMIPVPGVVRYVGNGENGEQVLGIQFTDISTSVQNRIISFVFNEQLRIRREKLL